MTREGVTMQCACKSKDRYDCWALRYHHHTAVPGMTVDEEGGPCECSCHDEEEVAADGWLSDGSWKP